MTVVDAIEFVVSLKGGSEASSEAHKLRGALGGVRGEIGGIGKESPKAAAGTAMLGSSFKKMAGGIVAAGLAYKAYSLAKGALTFTDDLVHATKTLTGATKMNVQEASRWIGTAEALGIQGNAVTTAFTKLAIAAKNSTDASAKQTAGHNKQSAALTTLLMKQKAQLENTREAASHEKNRAAAEAKIASLERTQLAQRAAQTLKDTSSTKAAASAFSVLGISQAEVTAKSKNMGELMTLVVKKLKDVHNPTEKAAVLTKLFGRSYADLGPLLLQGNEALEKMLGAAKRFGVEIKSSGQKGLEEYNERMTESKLATEGLQLRFSEIAIGPLKRLQEGFLAVATALRTGKWGDVEKQSEKLAGSFGKLVSHVLPVLVGAFAKMGPILLKALWAGFLNANLGGKAVLAAALFYKLGFVGAAFSGKGDEMGRAFGAAFVIAAVAAAAAAAHAALSGAAAITQLLGAGADAEAAELKDPLVRKTREHNRYLETHPSAKRAAEKHVREHPMSFAEYQRVSRAAAGAAGPPPLAVQRREYEREFHHPAHASRQPFAPLRQPGPTGDIVINVDGRQLMRVTRRQQMQAQAQGAG